MKKKSFQPFRSGASFLTIIAVFLVILIISGSCGKQDPLIIKRGNPAANVGRSEMYSFAHVLPPVPDTHYVPGSVFMNHNEMEVDYISSSMEPEKSAQLMGPNDEILGTAIVESVGKPEMVSGKPVYHMKAVFKLDKTANHSLLKVTLPNSAAVPDSSNEIFFIKIK